MDKEPVDPMENPEHPGYSIFMFGGILFRCYNPCGACSLKKLFRCIADYIDQNEMLSSANDIELDEESLVPRSFEPEDIEEFFSKPDLAFNMLDVCQFSWNMQDQIWEWNAVPSYTFDMSQLDKLMEDEDKEEEDENNSDED